MKSINHAILHAVNDSIDQSINHAINQSMEQLNSINLICRHGGTPWLKGLPISPFYQSSHLDLFLVLVFVTCAFFAFCLRARQPASAIKPACLWAAFHLLLGQPQLPFFLLVETTSINFLWKCWLRQELYAWWCPIIDLRGHFLSIYANPTFF